MAVLFLSEETLQPKRKFRFLWKIQRNIWSSSKRVPSICICTFYHEGRGGSTNYNIRIYVSKNTEPFVLKSQKSGTFPDGGSDEASYTIDF